MSDPFSILLNLVLVLALGPIVILFFTRIRPLTLLIIHIGSRWVLDSFPQVTYSFITGSYSPIKIYSIIFTITAIGYLAYIRAPFPKLLLVFFHAICIPIILSTVYNGQWMPGVEQLLKWVYLATIISLVMATLRENSVLATLKWVSLLGLYPLANVGFAFFTGNSFELGGVTRYIGTYYHPSHISFIWWTIIGTSLYWTIMEKRLFLKIIPLGILAAAHIGLFFASYRTLWIGVAVFWFIVFAISLTQLSWRQQIPLHLIASILIVLSIAQGGKAIDAISDRLAPVMEVLSNPSDYIDVQDVRETYILSGRLDFVNMTLVAYQKSSPVSKFFGLGPNAVIRITGKYSTEGTYAHNEYVSALVEFGILGFLGFMLALLMFSKRIVQSLQNQDWSFTVSLAVFFGTLIAALGTMPFRDMLGILMFGLFTAIAISKKKILVAQGPPSHVSSGSGTLAGIL